MLWIAWAAALAAARKRIDDRHLDIRLVDREAPALRLAPGSRRNADDENSQRKPEDLQAAVMPQA